MVHQIVQESTLWPNVTYDKTWATLAQSKMAVLLTASSSTENWWLQNTLLL